jgi:peroxiredoxin (alkyl hydroperoxide reductase subunit C)
MLLGKPAPDFSMTTTKDLNNLDHVATLESYRGKWLVLFFYPADFTFVCPTEVLAFNTSVPVLESKNTEILGVSTDSVWSHVAWMEFHIGNLDFPLASDRSLEVCRNYGVLGEDSQAARGLFIIDPEGFVRYEVVHDEPVGRSVNEMLRVLDALQTPGRTWAHCQISEYLEAVNATAKQS